jgi:hypothetical protein
MIGFTGGFLPPTFGILHGREKDEKLSKRLQHTVPVCERNLCRCGAVDTISCEQKH